jgi:hypothetical protein
MLLLSRQGGRILFCPSVHVLHLASQAAIVEALTIVAAFAFGFGPGGVERGLRG